MACEKDEGGCVTFTWEIQNFGLFLALEKGSYWTPFWKTEHNRKRVWRRLSIRTTGFSIYFGIFSPTKCLHIDRCEVSIISSCMEVPLKVDNGNSSCWSYTVKREDLFNEKRQSILPNNTLTLRFKMWEKTMETRQFRINSVLHKFRYVWNIENFRPDDFYSEYIEKENFLFKAQIKSEKDSHNFLFGEVSSKESVVLPINCELSVKTGSVNVIKEICNYSYNIRIYEIEICLNSTTFNLQLESVFVVHKVRQYKFKLTSAHLYEKDSDTVSGALGNNLLLLYRDQLFSDATLNVEGRSFHVHRSILAARSPVFRAMFEKDEMSEARSGAVDIDDVDSDTVDRMLVFLYGDAIESMQQWEEASALYYAADKYDIQPLKHKCASNLKKGLTVDNACEGLVLADRHSDDQLMKCIVDFLRQNEEVMSSKKWDSFENSNPLLSSKILREIYVKNKNK